MPQDPFARHFPTAGGSDPFARPATVQDDVDPFASTPPVRSKWGDYAGMAMRGLTGFLAGEGGPVGALVSGAGDLAAQTVEKFGGSRDKYNLGEAGVSSAAGAIPFGRAGSLIARMLKGSAIASGTSAAMDVASQLGDDDPSAFDIGRTGRAARSGAVLGTAGAGAGALAEKFIGRGRSTGVLAKEAGLERQPRLRAGNNVVDVPATGAPEPFHVDTPAQTPQIRQPNNVVDVGEGGGEPFAMGDTPTRRPPFLRQPSNVTDIPATGTPEPFEIGSASPAQVDRVSELERRLADEERRHADTLAFFKKPGASERVEGGYGTQPDVPFSELPDINAPTAAAETGIENARRRGVPFVPSELVTTHQQLRPKWDQTLAETGSDQRESLPFFSRRVLGTENPRKLMGAERKALKAAKDAGKPIYPGEPRDEFSTGTGQPVSRPDTVETSAFPGGRSTEEHSVGDLVDRLYDDESGSIDPVLARRLGLHAGSAAAGAGLAGATSDDEHRTRNMLGGAAVGAVAPLGPSKLGKLRYFSLLGSTGAQTKNLVGNAGAVLVRAGEEAAIGNTAGAKKLLSSVFSTQTVKDSIDAFKHAPAQDTRWGKNTGVLGTFSRIMHSIDEGATKGMQRGGLSNDDARTSLFTAEPKSKAGKSIASRAESLSAIMPFVRTGVNALERGMEHTPGVGLLPAVRAMRGSSTNRVMARQAMGALAMLAGGAVGADNPTVGAALGPLAFPFSAGAAGRRAYDKTKHKGDLLTTFAKEEADTLRRALPFPTDAYDFDPGKYLSTFVPGVGRDASLVNPNDLDTSGGLFDPSIAKIPYLNAAMLRRKPKARKAVTR